MNDQLNSRRYPLQNLLLEDIFANNKMIILLLIAILVTGLSTIWLTHQTRALVSEKGSWVFEKQAFENEYVNLQLEETTLSHNSRIESIATRIGMKAVDPAKEVVIVE